MCCQNVPRQPHNNARYGNAERPGSWSRVSGFGHRVNSQQCASLEKGIRDPRDQINTRILMSNFLRSHHVPPIVP